MGGFIYRLGVHLKEKGELEGSDWLIRLGLRIREVGLKWKN
jgi:hypothetical protein